MLRHSDRHGASPARKSFARLALALCVCAVASVAACDSKDSDEGAPEKVMVFARGSDSVGLDPAHEDDGESFNVTCNIYDQLVMFLPGSIQVGPGLAEKWDISPDGKQYTFHLRKNVKFHDGTPFNADAVLFSLLRQHDPKHPFANVGGPYKYWPNTGMNQLIEAIEKIDDHKVVMKLTTPYAPFLANLAMDFCSIVSPTAVQTSKERFNAAPIGTGPFEFDSWARGQKIVLRANKEYWGGKVLIDKLVFVSIPDNTARFQAYKGGQVDGFNFPNPFELQEIQKTPNTQFLTQSGLNVFYLAFNTQKPPFDNVLVRRAINHAINKDGIVKAFYQGLGTVAKSPVPPVMGWAHNFNVKDYEYNRDKAKQLLKEAKLEKGFETTLWIMSNPRPYILAPDKVAAAAIADLEAVGIRAKKVTYDWPTYLDKTDHGEHDMAFLGWSSDNGDPDNFMYMLLSKHATAIPATNISFYKSDPLSDLLDQARVIANQDERAKLYRKAQEVFVEDAPWVPIAHSVQVLIMRDYVKGFQLHPTTKTDFRGVAVAKPGA